MSGPRRSRSEQYARLWGHVEPEGSRLLLLAALEEFATKGFHASTTRDIAQRIGMSPGAIYVHYKSKSDLLFEIIRIGHESLLSDVKDATAAAAGEVEQVRAFAETFTDWHARYHTLAQVAHYETRALQAEHLKEIRRLRRKFADFLEELVARGEAAGVFTVTDRPTTVTALLSLGIDVARWYGVPGSPEPEELAHIYGEFVGRMLAAEPDRSQHAAGLALPGAVD